MRPLVLLILATGLACRDTKALLVVNRHGSRYSYSNADPPSLRTELTRNGLRMSYLLGRFLRQRYAAFFPARFNSNENVVVASSANNAAWTPLDFTPTQRAAYGDATLNSDRGGLA